MRGRLLTRLSCSNPLCEDLFNRLLDRWILDREIADGVFLQQALYDPCSSCPGHAQFHLPLFRGDDLAKGSKTGYFIGCLRLMYFREYKFGADVKAAFPMIQEVSRRYGAREIPTSTDYSAALNFYRLYFRDTTIQPFQDSDPTAPGKLAYVLPYDSAREFIRKEGLKIIYRGELTDLVILIRADSSPH